MCHPNWRRRSADIGGLYLATGGGGYGQGWLATGDGDGDLYPAFAELLSDMYTHLLNSINDAYPPSLLHPPPLTPYTVQPPLDPAARNHLISLLDSWSFQPSNLHDNDVAATLLIFEAIFRIDGMQAAVGVSLAQLAPFIHHLRRLYRDNKYHNFHHALDVLQAIHSYLQAAGVVPPLTILNYASGPWSSSLRFDAPGMLITSLTLRDIFALYIAAIGHDVGHPGVTNAFMKNASSRLSLVFEGKSALEQMHCQFLLLLMRTHGLGHLLDDYAFRKLLWSTIMATDMSAHLDFMQGFECLIRDTDREQGPVLMRKIAVCQAMLKCADISNPSRPFEIAAYWADALGSEWACQAQLEKELAIDQTMPVCDGPLSLAKGQVSFSTAYVCPLLELMVRAVPRMRKFFTCCQLNLEIWKGRKLHLESSLVSQPPPSTPMQHPDTYVPAYPLNEYPPSLIPYQGSFPLALPTLGMDGLDHSSTSGSTTSGDGSGEAESAPTSPSASSSASDVSSFSSTPQAPRTIRRSRPPSEASSTSGGGSIITDYRSIRNAADMGVRKGRKPQHRHSWCPDSLGSFLPEENNVPSPPPPPSAPGLKVACSPRFPSPPMPSPASTHMQLQLGSGIGAPPSPLQLRAPPTGLGFKGVSLFKTDVSADKSG
ncbi:hypothetical protein BDQ17DRAFT_1273998 [Cyathus striatus]|nr:hypothetical protein BDQ17DRAFT_1273998 [Cyathus striatus]